MNGNWLEALQTLGFDLMLIAIVTLLVLNAVEPIYQRWRARVRARQLQAVAPGSTRPAQAATGTEAPSALVAATGQRSRRPEWLAGAMKGLPTQYPKASPGTPAAERTTPPGQRAA